MTLNSEFFFTYNTSGTSLLRFPCSPELSSYNCLQISAFGLFSPKIWEFRLKALRILRYWGDGRNLEQSGLQFISLRISKQSRMTTMSSTDLRISFRLSLEIHKNFSCGVPAFRVNISALFRWPRQLNQSCRRSLFAFNILVYIFSLSDRVWRFVWRFHEQALFE